jgi:tetratricopeptide (TPR) repeat protein
MKRSLISLWLQSRPWTLIWWSSPVLLAFAGWLAFGYCMLRWKHQEIGAQYSAIVERALERKDFDTARIGCQRLLSIGAEPRAKWLFSLGLAYAGGGRDRDASTLFSSLAPIEKPGYLPAHIFLAQALMSRTNLTLEDVQTAEKHLVHALSLDPKYLGANELLAQVYIRTGQWELACQRLTEVVPKYPEVGLLLAAVLKERGDLAGARSWADRAARFHREKVEASKLELPLHRCGWAQALAMLEDYKQALKVLEAGWTASADRSYPPMIGDVCAAWVEAMTQKNSPDLEAKLTTIEKGLEFAPQNELLLKQLVRLSQMGGNEGQKARETLTKSLAEGKGTAVIHFALGLDAWQRQQPDLARKHFGLAFDSAPLMPEVGNNMAMILAVGDKPDLPRALEIIQSLLEKYPKSANFRETRGEIYVKMDRWQEAVVDLEYALPVLGSRRNTHFALAEAYRGLGSQELAAQHERLAKSVLQATP